MYGNIVRDFETEEKRECRRDREMKGEREKEEFYRKKEVYLVYEDLFIF